VIMKKNSTDIFGDENAADESTQFAELFNQAAFGSGRKAKPGDKFKGEILSIGKEEVIVSIGPGMDASLPTQDIKDSNGVMKYKKHDHIEVVVIKSTENETRLALASSKSAVSGLEELEDAFDMELPIEGKVIEAVKGGFRVKVMGKMAFCPVSQIDLNYVADLTPFVGQTYEFVITQMADKGNVVVSRRKVLEMQRVETEGEFIKSAKVGDIVEAKVTRLENFGAFVEVKKGVEGLVHISEIGWSRIKHPSEMLAVGAMVRVKILKIEDEGDRMKLSLSIKQGGGEMDPWSNLSETFPVGKQIEGTIEKKEPFGLFVNIAPGITGLLPKSKFSDSIEGKSIDAKKKGDKIKVQIMQIMKDERRLSLGLPGEEQDETWKEHNSSSTSGFGTLADAFKKLKS
jgi:small subunit ribosomal protein S1